MKREGKNEMICQIRCRLKKGNHISPENPQERETDGARNKLSTVWVIKRTRPLSNSIDSFKKKALN